MKKGQVCSRLTPATNLPKAAPLDSSGAFGASLLTLLKERQKFNEEKKHQRNTVPVQTLCTHDDSRG